MPDGCTEKVREVGLRLAIGPLAVSVTMPVSDTFCGLPLALSTTFNVAVYEPAERTLGLNVTLITQLLSAATLVPHVLVCEKSAPPLDSKMLMPVPVMLSGAFRVRESNGLCCGLRARLLRRERERSGA